MKKKLGNIERNKLQVKLFDTFRIGGRQLLIVFDDTGSLRTESSCQTNNFGWSASTDLELEEEQFKVIYSNVNNI